MMPTTNNQEATAWYAVWTRPRHEKIVRTQLIHKRIEVFLPTVCRWSQWTDRLKRIEWPLFPGYCFARFNPSTEMLPVLKCDGVLSIVSFDSRPAVVSDDELNNLRLVVESEWKSDPCPLVHEGTMVEVIEGPLRGISGRLIRKDARWATVVLSVDLIQQAIRVEVDAAVIRPA